ncbi:hypothetical protein [Desulfurivibrio sp. C05AmB]|jgi:hypothetical protein|uniref:hypothetical protein n=1 Tax=Desulfurivibrio sp. C05AmB TaxID=3374371 RepID=UPI00376EC9A2
MKTSRMVGMLILAGMLGFVAFQGQIGGPDEAQARAGGYGAPPAPATGGYGAPPAAPKEEKPEVKREDEEKKAPPAGGYGAPPPRPGGGYGAPPPPPRPGGGYGR